MNLPRSSLFALLAVGSAVLFGACTKEDRSKAATTAQEAYDETKDALASGWDKVKSYSFDKRDEFTANAKALSARMEAQASKLRADIVDAQASASRKAALEELKNAEADYKEKLEALGRATADTWESAKQNVIAAWDRLVAAYQKARAD